MKTLLHTLGNAVALALQDVRSLPAAHVEHDAAGRPSAWRLFAWGPFRLSREGVEHAGDFAPEHADEILAQAERKGTPVPLDAHHALPALAKALGVEEPALAAALPGRRLALGFGRLARRDDGLWLEGVEWTDLGSRLVAGGHFRYYSPVIRGLSDGRLRITSVAMTNNPALQGLDALAAEADDSDDGCRGVLSLADLVGRRAAPPPAKKGEQRTMKRLLGLVGRLTGQDLAALEDAATVPETALASLDALAAELPALRAAQSLGKAVRDALALAADTDAATVEGTLRGLAAKGQAHDQLKARVDALELEAETRRRTAVIERGMAEGKLTKAMIDGAWCKGQSAVALEAFLAVAPVVVPQGRTVEPGRLPAQDSLALSDGELKILRTAGLTDKDIEAVKADRLAKKG